MLPGQLCIPDIYSRVYSYRPTQGARAAGCVTMQTFGGSVHSAKINDATSKSSDTGGYFEKKKGPFLPFSYIVITLHSRLKYLRGPDRENRITKPFLRIFAEYFFAQNIKKHPIKTPQKRIKTSLKREKTVYSFQKTLQNGPKRPKTR